MIRILLCATLLLAMINACGGSSTPTTTDSATPAGGDKAAMAGGDKPAAGDNKAATNGGDKPAASDASATPAGGDMAAMMASNPVIHFEIGIKKDTTKAFYKDVLGWTQMDFKDANYTMLITDTTMKMGINGGLFSLKDPKMPNYTTVYVGVKDVQATLDAAAKLGAKVIVPKMTSMGQTFGSIIDPMGNMMGFVEMKMPGAMTGYPTTDQPNPVVHYGIITSDYAKTRDFYTGLLGWKMGYESSDPKMKMGEIAWTPGSIGISGHIAQGEKMNWVGIYAMVASIKDTLAKVTAKGGKVVLDRMELKDGSMKGGFIAVFLDPEMNGIGLFEKKA